MSQLEAELADEEGDSSDEDCVEADHSETRRMSVAIEQDRRQSLAAAAGDAALAASAASAAHAAAVERLEAKRATEAEEADSSDEDVVEADVVETRRMSVAIEQDRRRSMSAAAGDAAAALGRAPAEH